MTGFNFGAMMSQENQIKQIPVNMLVPYHNHKFTLYQGERLDDMVESIRKNGVMTPIVVQPIADGNYEILIGHNRWNASKIAGLDFVPAIIKENLSEEEAEIYVIESNLLQRGFNELKISEQAQVLALRYDSLFSQGKRTDIINELRELEGQAPEKQSHNSREEVGAEYGLSRNTVARLLRIDKLNDGIKAWVDSGELSIRAAVELSYLSDDEQEQLCKANTDYTCYDKSELIDSFYSDTFVEYSKTNVKNKSFWTYDESNDTYVNKTESGKVVKSIPKYHLEDSNSSSKQSSSGKTESNNERSQNRNESDVAESAIEIDEDSSRIISGADSSNDNLSGSNSELEKATATVPLSTDDFAVLEAPQEENSSNQAVVAILISIGGLILAGIGVIIYLLIKNKKNKKSGDTNEKDKEDLQ